MTAASKGKGLGAKARTRLKVAIALNVLVVALEVWATCVTVHYNGVAGTFIFYTNCSNIFAGVACAIAAVAEVQLLRGGAKGLLGRGVKWLKYVASCCLLMTFFVVVAVLAPMLDNAGYPGAWLMFCEKARPVTHLGGPVLVVVSYLLFEADRAMTLRQSLVGFVPTFVYAMIAYACNYARVWDGPYPFFQVWNMPVWETLLWFVALFFLAYALCQIPRLIARRIRW